KTLFLFGEIGAEGKCGKAAAELAEHTRKVFRRVVTLPRRYFVARLDLPRLLRLFERTRLESRIRDRQHRGHRIAIRFPAKIGGAVFGDDDVLQMARDRLVAVRPEDV